MKLESEFKMKNFDAPRNEAGLIVPMVSQSGTDLDGKPLYFPVMPAVDPAAPIDPLIFIKDFEPGGRYENLTYAPGYYNGSLGIQPGGPWYPEFDPSKVTFLNPWLNIPALTNSIQAGEFAPNCIPSAQGLVDALATKGVMPTVPAEDPGMIEERGLFVPSGKGNLVRVCNYNVEVRELRKRIVRGKDPVFEFGLTVFTPHGEVRLTATEDKLSRLSTAISQKIPGFHLLEAHGVNAAAALASHVRDRSDFVPQQTVFCSAGWYEHMGNHLYIHDGLQNLEGIRCETKRTIMADPGLNAQQAFRAVLDFASIGKPEVMVPLVLTAYLGPLAALFEDAGHPPRYCLFLHGMSGSLKTAVSEVLADFYGSRDLCSFRASEAALSVEMEEHMDRLFLVDDFQPAETGAKSKQMLESAEFLIRAFGDGIARKRSNSRGSAVKGVSPRGSCIITGESLAGSLSSLLRCLLIPIQRGDIDGMKLRPFQCNHALWVTNFVYFLPWVGREWESMKRHIQSFYSERHKLFSQLLTEPRLIDTAAVMLLATEVLTAYGVACRAITADERGKLLDVWYQALVAAFSKSAELSVSRDLGELACEAIRDGIISGTLKIADSKGEYAVGFAGFQDNRFLWIRPESFISLLRRYCEGQRIACVTEPSSVYPQLLEKGLIVRDADQSKKASFLKRTPELPGFEGKRHRMLAFVRSALTEE